MENRFGLGMNSGKEKFVFKHPLEIWDEENFVRIG